MKGKYERKNSNPNECIPLNIVIDIQISKHN